MENMVWFIKYQTFHLKFEMYMEYMLFNIEYVLFNMECFRALLGYGWICWNRLTSDCMDARLHYNDIIGINYPSTH